MIHDPRPIAPINPKGLDDIARSLLEESTTPPQADTQLYVSANIRKSDYIKIPGTNVLIAKQESNKGLKWKDAHFALADNGLYMPTPALFMPYFLQVKEAAEGKTALHDGNNNLIQIAEARELWNYLSSTSRTRGNCWTWLDALFKEVNGRMMIETDHRIAVNQGKKELQGKLNPLEAYINENCYVDLSFNKQGLASRKSASTSYMQGQNIYFWHPVNERVARFGAVSDGAFLDCYEDTQGSDSGLGVFACAEGTPRS